MATLALMAADGTKGNFELGKHFDTYICELRLMDNHNFELADQQFWTLRIENLKKWRIYILIITNQGKMCVVPKLRGRGIGGQLLEEGIR